MKIKNIYYFILGVLSLQEDLRIVSGKAVTVTSTDKNLGIEFENYMNCASNHSSNDCLERTGRKRKGDGGGAGNNVVVVSGGGGGGVPIAQDHSLGGGYYEVYEDDDDGGKKGRKGKKKKNKGKKKMYKHIKHGAQGIGALMLLFQHFALKKLAFFSFFSFILSKISFILATLVALKQFFHNSGGHSRDNKLEVIHIPIKKKHPSIEDWDESKIVPITFSASSFKPSTTSPFKFTYPSHDSFLGSDENYSEEFVPKVNNAGEYNFDNSGSAIDDFDRTDKSGTYDEKSYYINHVHSPFV